MAKQPLENLVQHLFHITARAEFKTLNDQQLLQRYVEQRDDLAFGELVRRHEAMVWNVCWRILKHRQDVEDAFQATFLALFRRAATIVSHESIEGWLHNVVYKAAHNLKIAQIRRHVREERRAQMREESFQNEIQRWELGEVLDRELTRIPEKFRSPLILCYLEGLTQKQAAQRLGISIDALDGRLREGKARLEKRLSGQGLNLSMPMLWANLSSVAHLKEVPPGLVDKTLNMVRILAMSQGVLGTAGISPQVALLSQSALGAWTVKMKILMGVLLLSLVGIGGGMAKYAGWLSFQAGEPLQGMPGPVEQEGDKPATPAKQPPRTDRYGDPLPVGALERLGTTRFRMDKFYNARHRIAVTPDKKLFIHGNTDGTQGNPPRCYDLRTGKLVQQLRDAHGQAIALASDMMTSCDGRLLVQRITPHGAFGFWNLTTGEPLDLRVTNAPHEMALSRDGNFMAIMTRTPDKGGFDLGIWDNKAGRYRWTKDDKGRLPRQIAYSSDGKILLALCPPEVEQRPASKKLLVRRWEMATGKELARWIVPHAELFSWSPDGGTLAVSPSWRSHTIHLWNMSTGKELRQIELGDKVQIRGVTLSPDGNVVAASTLLVEQEVHPSLGLWDTVTGKLLRRWDSLIETGDWTFSHDSQWLVAVPQEADIRRTIYIWDIDSEKLVNQVWHDRGHHEAITSLSFSRQSETLISTGRGGSLNLWSQEAETAGYALHPLRPCGGDGDRSRLSNGSFAFSPNSQWLAMGGHDDFYLWDIIREKIAIKERVGQVLDLALSPDGRTLAVSIKTENSAHAVHLLRVGTDEWGIRFEGLRPFITAPAGTEFSLLTFSPDGRTLAAQGKNTQRNRRDTSDGVIHLWETATGQERVCFNDHGSLVTSLAFAPDGRRLVSGHEDSTILIWDVTGRLEVGKLRPIRLSDQTLAALWDDLAGDDAARASQAMWILAAGARTVSFFKKRLRPARENKISVEATSRLIAPLDEGERIARVLSAEELRAIRALEVLEQIGQAEARRLLEVLASGDPAVSLTQEAQVSLHYWKNTYKSY